MADELHKTNSYWCGKSGPHPLPSLPGPSNYRAEIAWRRNEPQAPKWSLGTKLEMVPGGVVPSWVNSIPGPKYRPNLDKFTNEPPAWSIQGRTNIPGGPLALQGRVEHEVGQQYRQLAKGMNPSVNGCTMSDTQLLDQRASAGICGCFTPLAERHATGRLRDLTGSGSAASLSASRILRSSGRSQVCSVGYHRRGVTGATGLSGVSSTSLKNAVLLEVAKQTQPLRDDVIQPLRNGQQAKTRQQRLEEILQRAQGSS